MTVSPLSGAQQILAALSCVGGIFVIYCVARWPQLRSFAYRLVAMLVLAQVLGAAVHLLPEAQSGDLLCFIQAILTSYAWLATMLWCMATAFTLHMAFLQERTTFDSGEIENHSFVFNSFCWGTSFVLSLLPLSTSSYGRNPVGVLTIDDDGVEDESSSCWLLTAHDASFIWRIIQVYAPMWLATIYCIWVCIRVRMKMDALHAASIRYGVQSIEPMSERMFHARQLIVRLRNYPLMLIFTHFAAVINRAYQLFGEPIVWFNIIQILFLAVQGLVTSMIFACTPEVCAVLMRPSGWCRRLCQCCCRSCPRCCACGQRVGQQGLCGLLATTAMDGAHEFEPLSLDEEGLPAEPGESGHGTSGHAASPIQASKDGLLDLHLSLGTDTEAEDSGLDVELELFGSSHHPHHNHTNNNHDNGHHNNHTHTHSNGNGNGHSGAPSRHRALIEMSDDSEPELPLGRGRSHRPITSYPNTNNTNNTKGRHLRDLDGL